MIIPLTLLCTSSTVIRGVVASSTSSDNYGNQPNSSSNMLPRLAGIIACVIIISLLVTSVSVCVRRGYGRNSRLRYRGRYRNPVDIIPQGGGNYHPPPLPFHPPPIQPVRPILFPTPSTSPPNDPPPAFYAPPREPPRSAAANRSPEFPTPRNLAPATLQPPAASSLSRGSSAASSLHATSLYQHSTLPPASSVSPRSFETHDSLPSQATMTMPASSPMVPLREEMTAYQKQLAADQERRKNADTGGGPSSDPPPQYSE